MTVIERPRIAETYLVIRPGRIGKAVIERSTKGMPQAVPGDAIVVKLSLAIPERAFRPPVFEATVDVPEDYVGRIIVQAHDPAPPEEDE